jgi:hypothetical protein
MTAPDVPTDTCPVCPERCPACVEHDRAGTVEALNVEAWPFAWGPPAPAPSARPYRLVPDVEPVRVLAPAAPLAVLPPMPPLWALAAAAVSHRVANVLRAAGRVLRGVGQRTAR